MAKVNSFDVATFNEIALNSKLSKAGYIAFCEFALENLGRKDSVVIDYDAVDRFATQLPPPAARAQTRSEYLSSRAANGPLHEVRVVHEFAAIVGQMGGFFEVDKSDSTLTHHWALDGSGSKAVLQKMHEVRKALGEPGDGETRPSVLNRKLKSLFRGATMPEWRAAAMKEFYVRGAMDKTHQILRDSAPGLKPGEPVVGASLAFNTATLHALSEAFPVSLGGDPLFKKATLTLLHARSHLDARRAEWMPGQNVSLETILASDYRIPQATTADETGMVKIDQRLRDDLLNSKIMDINDPEVVKLRISSILVGNHIEKKTGFETNDVDSALITLGRRLSREDKAMPEMKVITPFF